MHSYIMLLFRFYTHIYVYTSIYIHSKTSINVLRCLVWISITILIDHTKYIDNDKWLMVMVINDGGVRRMVNGLCVCQASSSNSRQAQPYQTGSSQHNARYVCFQFRFGSRAIHNIVVFVCRSLITKCALLLRTYCALQKRSLPPVFPSMDL